METRRIAERTLPPLHPLWVSSNPIHNIMMDPRSAEEVLNDIEQRSQPSSIEETLEPPAEWERASSLLWYPSADVDDAAGREVSAHDSDFVSSYSRTALTPTETFDCDLIDGLSECPMELDQSRSGDISGEESDGPLEQSERKRSAWEQWSSCNETCTNESKTRDETVSIQAGAEDETLSVSEFLAKEPEPDPKVSQQQESRNEDRGAKSKGGHRGAKFCKNLTNGSGSEQEKRGVVKCFSRRVRSSIISVLPHSPQKPPRLKNPNLSDECKASLQRFVLSNKKHFQRLTSDLSGYVTFSEAFFNTRLKEENRRVWSLIVDHDCEKDREYLAKTYNLNFENTSVDDFTRALRAVINVTQTP